MATEPRAGGSRRTWVLFGILVVVTIVAAVIWRGRAPAAGPVATSNTQRRGAGAGTKTTPGEDLDVRLEALGAEREQPAGVERNPFRFEARRRPESESGERAAAPPPRPEVEPTPAVPSGPPPQPPIPLKFIGIIESPEAGRVAALTDGRRVFQGRVGDIIEGRYKIVRIGVESIVLEYADGSGAQQTIRLSGQ